MGRNVQVIFHTIFTSVCATAFVSQSENNGRIANRKFQLPCDYDHRKISINVGRNNQIAEKIDLEIFVSHMAPITV